MAISGTALGWIEVRGLHALTSTAYGRLLMIKVPGTGWMGAAVQARRGQTEKALDLCLEAAKQAVDLNVILLLFSMMALVGVLKTTNVFSWAVDRLLERSRGNPSRAARLIIWFTLPLLVGFLAAQKQFVATMTFTGLKG